MKKLVYLVFLALLVACKSQNEYLYRSELKSAYIENMGLIEQNANIGSSDIVIVKKTYEVIDTVVKSVIDSITIRRVDTAFQIKNIEIVDTIRSTIICEKSGVVLKNSDTGFLKKNKVGVYILIFIILEIAIVHIFLKKIKL